MAFSTFILLIGFFFFFLCFFREEVFPLACLSDYVLTCFILADAEMSIFRSAVIHILSSMMQYKMIESCWLACWDGYALLRRYIGSNIEERSAGK